MRYELTDHEWTAIRPTLPNKPRGVPRMNNRRSSMAALGRAVRCAMARSAGEFWAAHDLLQSLRSLAHGWRVGPDHECIERRP